MPRENLDLKLLFFENSHVALTFRHLLVILWLEILLAVYWSMKSEKSPPSAKCCDCKVCNCSSSMMKRSFSETYLMPMKRKYDELGEENQFTNPGFTFPQKARVGIGNECMALREMVTSQQQTIQDLVSELEEERNASSSAAKEAMSMILRLQRGKAEIQMEARQFKRFAEERMTHDQKEAVTLEDLLYKREQTIQSLTCAVQVYKHRMMSYGLSEVEAEGDQGQFIFPPYDYPPLKCNPNESRAYPDGDDYGCPVFENYASEETPCSRDQLMDLEYRINQLERSPRVVQPDGDIVSSKNVLEKVIVGYSPRTPSRLRNFSIDSSYSPLAISKEIDGLDFVRDSPKSAKSFKKTEFSYIQENSNSRKVDNGSEVEDDLYDRIYTIDSVYQGAPFNRVMDSNGISGESLYTSDVRDIEMQKLYARLHALEADRESMRHAIISIGTDKAQVQLLKEIAQNLCKEVPLGRGMPVRRQSSIGSFLFMSVFKWILPLFFWRKKARRCRYMFGLSPNNAGLLILLDRGRRVGQWRCILNTNV